MGDLVHTPKLKYFLIYYFMLLKKWSFNDQHFFFEVKQIKIFSILYNILNIEVYTP